MKIAILSQGECSKRIDRLKTLTGRVQEQIHIVAVSCLVHTRDHGDYTLAERLLNALPNGQRVKTLAKWFKVFSSGKLTFRQADSKFVGKLADRVPEDFDIEGAELVPFGLLEAEKTQGETMSIQALLAYLRRKADDDKLLDTGAPRVHPEARALAQRLLAFAAAGETLKTELVEAVKSQSVGGALPIAAEDNSALDEAIEAIAA